jgi:Fe(3+) dicitrate transport protein
MAYGQTSDSMQVVHLNEVVIKDQSFQEGRMRMPDVKDHVIYAGKKAQVILLHEIQADRSTNNQRQLFARVPGISIWENDGSGIQINVANRGLSPNRSWEFNVRQNGYDICAEIFGYPEAYYSPPMEAVERIEILRGSASLQYGPQFGGLLNYQIKKGHPEKPLALEIQQTMGSYGLINTYHALGGTHKKFSYYAFFHHRTAEGWRQNSRYRIYSGFFSACYRLNGQLTVGVEYTRMDYQSQQPGGLTDDQYYVNHRQSFRERNWLGTPWNVAALTMQFEISSSADLQIKAFSTLSERNSVGFTRTVNINDTINPITGEHSHRQVDRDHYRNFGTEARWGVKSNFFGIKNFFAAGVRAYRGQVKRNQLGTGTTGDDFDLTLTVWPYRRSLEFKTLNYALFAEHIFYIGKRLKAVPGVRFEYIENTRQGYLDTMPAGMLHDEKHIRSHWLYGIGSEFNVTEKTSLYANYSLAFRPVTFSELTPSVTTEIIDPNLKDMHGFNADVGYRGAIRQFLSFDVGVFYLHYGNRTGIISLNGVPFRTNLGTSVNKGVESYLELDVVKMFTENSRMGYLSIFSSHALIDARYIKWNHPAMAGNAEKAIAGKRVENAPRYIHRLGVTYSLKGFSATWQISRTGDVYTDAANTDLPNASGTIGKLPAYQLMDISLCWKFLERYNLQAGVNNVANTKYATRRASGYPGPGLMPGNGRTCFLSFGLSL